LASGIATDRRYTVTSAHYRVNPFLNFNQLRLSCIAGR
jgi:hypothetical protein